MNLNVKEEINPQGDSTQNKRIIKKSNTLIASIKVEVFAHSGLDVVRVDVLKPSVEELVRTTRKVSIPCCNLSGGAGKKNLLVAIILATAAVGVASSKCLVLFEHE